MSLSRSSSLSLIALAAFTVFSATAEAGGSPGRGGSAPSFRASAAPQRSVEPRRQQSVKSNASSKRVVAEKPERRMVKAAETRSSKPLRDVAKSERSEGNAERHRATSDERSERPVKQIVKTEQRDVKPERRIVKAAVKVVSGDKVRPDARRDNESSVRNMSPPITTRPVMDKKATPMQMASQPWAKPDPRVTMPSWVGKPVPSQGAQQVGGKPVLTAAPPASAGKPVATPLPPPGSNPITVGQNGNYTDPGARADGGNANNNAQAGQRTGGQVGRGGTAIDSSDTNATVGKDGTLVIGGASANGGNNNGNATGQDARSGNGAGKGGKVIDDRDYTIDPSQGSTIVVKADTANGGSGNGNGSDGGRAGRGNGNGGKVIDDRDIVIKGGDQGNTIIIEKDQAKSGGDNGGGNGKAGKVRDKRDIKIEVDQGDKIVYGGKEVKAQAGDVVEIHNGHVKVTHGGQ